ncbi:hypothetical protein [Roseateles amylovorans]|uniref:CHAT domain-containing protein n=1 Tax=Roseateles amylovorans TaxID=2978473 RepID=A0ABY6AUC8_9BURK|nr:hypothetical protein [Roseateles amylovorans]UXH76826.1 hypothetical protein N4261_17535 [Roseateles amylovorans]
MLRSSLHRPSPPADTLGSTDAHSLHASIADQSTEAARGIFHTGVEFPPLIPEDGRGPDALTLDALPTVDLRSTAFATGPLVREVIKRNGHLTMPSSYPAEPFFPGQMLGTVVSIPAGGIDQPEAFRGWMARQVGAVLKDRCKLQSPVPLDFADLNHQLRLLQQSGRTDGLSCFLKTDAGNQHLCLAFMREGAEIAESRLLNLSRIPHGVVAIELEPMEGSYRDSVDRLASHHNGSASVHADRLHCPSHLKDKLSPAKPLANLPPTQRLMVIGHGGWNERDSLSVPGMAETVGGLTPRELCRKLRSMGLSPNHQGELTVFGCYAASEVDGRPSYLERLRDELAKSGYRHLVLAGPLGRTWVSNPGAPLHSVHLPQQEWEYLPQTLQKSEQWQAQMEQRLQMYRSMATAKNDEGQDLLNDDERQLVMDDMAAATIALQRERTYHAGLKTQLLPLRDGSAQVLLDRVGSPLQFAFGLRRYQDLHVRMGPKPK